MASLDYDPAHAYPGCQGYFEWEGEVKTAKRSCWGCDARDEYRYWVEPIVEGTNTGGHMEVASTPELANLGHLVYQLNNKVAFLERRLGEEEKKVATLEVNNRELAVGFEHLMEFHVGSSETALRAAATAFLPFLFGCKSVEFGCKSSSPSNGQSGEAFAGGVRSRSSSSSDRVPPLIPCSSGDSGSSSISPSLLQLDSPSSSPVEDRSGGISRRSQRVKRKGQRCRPSRLSTRHSLKEQERKFRDLPQTLASLDLDGGSLPREGSSQSCNKCWDLPCTYEL